jgi:hypothetical protein
MTNLAFEFTLTEGILLITTTLAVIAWWDARMKYREFIECMVTMSEDVADGKLTFKRNSDGRAVPIDLNQTGKPNAT